MVSRTVVDSISLVDGPPDSLDALNDNLQNTRRRFPGAIIERYLDRVPHIGERVHVAASAALIGKVELADDVSVWFGCVLRADINDITINSKTNIQDGTVIHLGDRDPVLVEEEVVVGHRAVLHGCRVGAGSLVGIQATILDGAVIGEECIVAAGALVTAGTQVPARSLVAGMPASVLRKLSPDEAARQRKLALKYVRLAHNYRVG